MEGHIRSSIEHKESPADIVVHPLHTVFERTASFKALSLLVTYDNWYLYDSGSGSETDRTLPTRLLSYWDSAYFKTTEALMITVAAAK